MSLASIEVAAGDSVVGVAAGSLSLRGGGGSGNAVLGENLLVENQSLQNEERADGVLPTSSYTRAIAIAASKVFRQKTRIIALSSGRRPSMNLVV